MTHNQLCYDLAYCKDTMYVEVPLGSVWGGINDRNKIILDNYLAGNHDKSKMDFSTATVQIADVINIRPSYTRFTVDIFEVKRSRADFLSDIRKEKWRGYLKHCNRFYFAVESGVAKKEDIPKEAGLIVRGDKGWSTTKQSPNRDNEIPYETMMAMLFYRKKHDRRIGVYWDDKKLLKRVGKEVAEKILFYNKYHWKLKDQGMVS